jgi:aspartate aminotransferase
MIRLADHLPPDANDLGRRALNPIAREMQGSLILQIAAEVRALIASGQPVCNLTVGDFDPKQFPIPRLLRDATIGAYDAGQTNYPPSEGIPELRKAVCAWYARELGIDISPDWVVIASGARPVMYATFKLFLEPGDDLVFAVPSWNNGYYAQLNGARAVAVPTRAEDNFFPTAATIAGPLERASVFSLNSPLNPTGTVIAPEQLAGIANAVVAENARRNRVGAKPLIWMWDQVYWQLVFGSAKHAHPCALVPEVTPYVVTVDAISKAFAATGVRVGWAVLPPVLAERMKALLGHVGAWAPRPEQVATVKMLEDPASLASFHQTFAGGLYERLQVLSGGLRDLGVHHLVPQGAMYLSVRFELFGRNGVDGRPMRTNEDVRKFLLREAGLAVVPFQAFDLNEENGWFRMSIGAVSVADLTAMFGRLAKVLQA